MVFNTYKVNYYSASVLHWTAFFILYNQWTLHSSSSKSTKCQFTTEEVECSKLWLMLFHFGLLFGFNLKRNDLGISLLEPYYRRMAMLKLLVDHLCQVWRWSWCCITSCTGIYKRDLLSLFPLFHLPMFPQQPQQLDETMRIPKETIDILKDQVFAFDTFFVTSQEPYEVS